MAGVLAGDGRGRGRVGVTREPIDHYLAQLRRALQDHGLEDPRAIDEAREHLADAVDDARRRGMADDDAARDAIDRFGAPRLVATQMARAEDWTMTRIAAIVWQRKWWIVAPTMVTALVTAVFSHYFMPVRYRSESDIRITAPFVTAAFANRPEFAPEPSLLRFEQLNHQVMSRTRLERLIQEFDLYSVERHTMPMADVVERMRRDIAVVLVNDDRAREDEIGGFNVSFVAAEPKIAMRLTERLAALLVEEHVREHEGRAAVTLQFLDMQIRDLRQRLLEHERALEALRTGPISHSLSRADVIPYEVLQDRYRTLLVAREEAVTADGIARRSVGLQFRIMDPARLPERPVGPTRAGINVAGGVVGLGIGVMLVVVRSRSRHPEESAG